MKLKLLTAVIALFILCLTGCQKELSFETGSFPAIDSTGNLRGDMRAKINGVQWIADKNTSIARYQNLINISGLSNDDKFVTMSLQDSGIHQYTLYYDGTNAGAYQDQASSNTDVFTTNVGLDASETGGNVNITSINEVNKKMSGTFSFRTKRYNDGAFTGLTEGSFTNISFTSTALGGNSKDTFTAKIDGLNLNATLIGGINTFGTIDVSGTASAGLPNIGISMPENITTGTYVLGDLTSDYIGQYNKAGNIYLVASSGTLTILEHNTTTKRIRGNFSFDAVEFPGAATGKVEQGYFAISYQ